MSADLAAVARSIVDSNLYMTLATADEGGRPWASPVYYAPDGYSNLYWVSNPEAAHSRNLAVRPELAIVIFDSHVRIGTGQALYMEATAGLVEADQIRHGIGVFSRISEGHGGGRFGIDEVEPPARLRLYRASVTRHYVLDPEAEGDERTVVTLS